MAELAGWRAHRALVSTALLAASLGGVTCAGNARPSAPASVATPAAPLAAGLTPTIESTDPELKQALAANRAAPTVATLTAVAEAYVRLGVFDSALTFFNQAIAGAPRDARLFAARARAWRDWGRPDLALGDAHRSVSMDPASANAHNTLGTVQLALGLESEAGASFHEALRLSPEAPWALNNLCYLAFLGGDDQAAVSRCNEALARDPKSSVARNNLVLVHATAGRMEEARAVLMASGNRPRAFYNYGIVLMARREFAAAASAFDTACAEAPAELSGCRRAIEARELAARERSR